MPIKQDFLAVATAVRALPDRDVRVNAWNKMRRFASAQLLLEAEQLDRIARSDQDIADAKANADIDL